MDGHLNTTVTLHFSQYIANFHTFFMEPATFFFVTSVKFGTWMPTREWILARDTMV